MSEEIVDGLRDIESAVSRVEEAVRKVEVTVGKQTSFGTFLLWTAVIVVLPLLPGEIWHSKWRYALAFGIDTRKVLIAKAPHDCAFLAAPVGDKYCHYERVTDIIRWGKSNGRPVVSYDDGRTWSIFEPGPTHHIPEFSTVENVVVNWKKADD